MNGFASPIVVCFCGIVFSPVSFISSVRIAVATGGKIVVIGAVRLCFVMAGHVSAILFDIATLIPSALREGNRRCHHCDDQDDE